jgi:hypothetical protein
VTFEVPSIVESENFFLRILNSFCVPYLSVLVYGEYGKFRAVCGTVPLKIFSEYSERIYAYMEKTQRYTKLRNITFLKRTPPADYPP